jgi:hypothetical protein
MAVTIIGGVLVSTLLTLFVVPCVYSLLSKFESRKAHHVVLTETGEIVKTPEIPAKNLKKSTPPRSPSLAKRGKIL